MTNRNPEYPIGSGNYVPPYPMNDQTFANSGVNYTPLYPVDDNPGPYSPPEMMPPPYAAVVIPGSDRNSTVIDDLHLHDAEDHTAGGFAASSFSEKSVRHAFIRKVYLILTGQLLITVGVIALFLFSKPLKLWVFHHIWVFHLSYVLFIVLYFTLVCCKDVRRRSPGNFIALLLFTLVFSFMAGVISSTYTTFSVLVAFGISAAVCLCITIFAIQTKIDFTKCAGLLLVVSVVFLFTGLTCIIVHSVWGWNNTLHAIYGGIGALVFGLYLIFDTQMVFGGRRQEIDPEEYIFAALQLYVDVVNFFLLILSLFGNTK